MKREYVIAIAAFLAFLVTMTAVKVANIETLKGDSAVFFQVTENLANKGTSISQTFGSVTSYLFGSGLTKMPVDQIAANPLLPGPVKADDPLRGHAYYIFYALGLLGKFIPVHPMLAFLFVLSFAGIVAMSYFILRSKSVPALAALIFLLLVVSHPAWAESLLWGQFYPDRLFLLTGFIFMYYTYRQDKCRLALVVSGILCAVVNERGALMAGVFMLAYLALHWKGADEDRKFKLWVGIALFLYGLLMIKFILVNVYYGSFLPGSFTGLIAELAYPGFAQKIGLFFLINSPLLLLAAFAPRAGVIALLLMLPSVFGNIGGAEKIGWSTHYPSYYLPALVWAALLGYAALYRKLASENRTVAFYAGATVLVLFLNLITPNAFAPPVVSLANVGNNFLFQFPRVVQRLFGPVGGVLNSEANEMRQAIPEHSVVTTIESGMPFVYSNRTIEYFPVDIDHADYAIISAVNEAGTMVYGGAVSFRGPAATAELNTLIHARMVRDGYDFEHAKLLPALGMAIVKRGH